MLYAIIITACLIGTNDCRDYEKRAWDLPQLPTAQFKAAEMIAAEWAKDHPARIVKGIRVTKVELEEQST